MYGADINNGKNECVDNNKNKISQLNNKKSKNDENVTCTSRSMVSTQNNNECNSNGTTFRNPKRQVLGELDTNSTKFLNN